MIKTFSTKIIIGAFALTAVTATEALAQQSQEPAPHEVETRIGTLEYEAGFPTEETVEKLYDELDFQRAVLAHEYADNLVSFFSMNYGMKNIGGAEGTQVIWENFLDPAPLILTGNDTTIYGMNFLDLRRNGPMVVEVSESPFLGGMFDLWMTPIVGIGAKGGRFVVAPLDWDGTVPEGFELIRSKTGLAALFSRGLVIEGDVRGAVAAVENVRVYPLSAIDAPPATPKIYVSGKYMDTLSPRGFEFWERFATEIVPTLDPEKDVDASLLLSLVAPLGIVLGEPLNPTARQRQILTEAAEFGWLAAQAVSMEGRIEGMQYYEGKQWELWLVLDPTLTDRYWRDLEARTNYYFGATMAMPAMKEKRIGQGSQYLRTAKDADENWLDGANTYVLRVPPNVPALVNWSVTLHDYETRSQVQTDQNRAAIGNQTPNVVTNPDGSVDLYFAPEAPEGKEANWVKTVPGRGWWALFRWYSPTEAFFDKSWVLTDFQKFN